MPDTTPPSRDAELRETLDLLATVVASVSDRVDGQTEALTRLTRTAAETRQAAFQAKAQTDAGPAAAAIGAEAQKALGPAVAELRALQRALAEDRRRAHDRIEDLLTGRDAKTGARRHLLMTPGYREGRGLLWTLAAVLFVVAVLALPRFLAVHGPGCFVLGGQWIRGSTPFCAFTEG